MSCKRNAQPVDRSCRKIVPSSEVVHAPNRTRWGAHHHNFIFSPEKQIDNIGCSDAVCSSCASYGVGHDDGVFASDVGGDAIVNNGDNNVGEGIGGSASMGLSSVVGGVDSQASADRSVAFGYRSRASGGAGTFALGERTISTGVGSGNMGITNVISTVDGTLSIGGGSIQLQTEDTAVHAGRGVGGLDGVTGSGFMDYIPLMPVKTNTAEFLTAVEIGPEAIVRVNASVTGTVPFSVTGFHPGTTITLPPASALVGPNGRWKLAKPGDSWLFTVENLGTEWSSEDFGPFNGIVTSSTAYLTPPSGGGGGGWVFNYSGQVTFSTTVRFQVIVLNVGAGTESVELVRIDNLTSLATVTDEFTGSGIINEGDGTLICRVRHDGPSILSAMLFTMVNNGSYSFPISDVVIGSYFIKTTAPGKQSNISAAYLSVDESSCFVAGTRVLTSLDPNETMDVRTRNIEDLTIGDTVVGYNVETGVAHLDVIKGFTEALHETFVTLEFAGVEGTAITTITSTLDHPYLVRKKVGVDDDGCDLFEEMWCSFDVAKSKRLYSIPDPYLIGTIDVGDEFVSHSTMSTRLVLSSIKFEKSSSDRHTCSYTISELESGDRGFIANGLVVLVESLRTF